MEKQMIQGFWRVKHLVRCEQQQAIKPTCEGDGLGWGQTATCMFFHSSCSIRFLAIRRQILTDLHSHYFSLGSDGLG
jgi:hypothetical protein